MTKTLKNYYVRCIRRAKFDFKNWRDLLHDITRGNKAL